ncbi:unnamed protein product [Owenia fusiformis]|uniref:C2H2-type domain-containing protein n=1 Tax=Owenia fusiformis TaxID=6347 RepID=A0A8S4PFB5_OWEFU|nr:unnamed protein product [Owenia fusiformis]
MVPFVIYSGDGTEMQYKCDICQETFNSSPKLYEHREKIHNIKDFKCPYCDLDKPNLHEFVKHIYKSHFHQGEGIHKCPICGRGFKYKSAIPNHVLTHTKEKPHMCSTCGKSFTLLSTLKHHEEVHMSEGEKAYRCSQCGKCYGCEKRLKEHSKSHYKPHQCSLCGFRFSRQHHLNRHMKTQHSDLKKELKIKSDKPDSKNHDTPFIENSGEEPQTSLMQPIPPMLSFRGVRQPGEIACSSLGRNPEGGEYTETEQPVFHFQSDTQSNSNISRLGSFLY